MHASFSVRLDTRIFLYSKREEHLENPFEVSAMLQLSNKAQNKLQDGVVALPLESKDESMVFWVPRGTPGFYHACWNPDVVPKADSSAYTFDLGTVEISPTTKLVGKLALQCTR